MNTFSGLEFFKNNIEKHYCYHRSMLSPDEQTVYDEIRLGFLSYSDKIHVSNISCDRVSVIFEKLKFDNPCLFFVECVSYLFIPPDRVTAVIPKYRFSREQTESNMISMLNKCKSIIAQCQWKRDIEKEKCFHDYFCQSVKYDDDFAESSFECVGPLIFGKGVCSGISKAVKLLCDLSDMKAIVIGGESSHMRTVSVSGNNLHAWNIICIDNAFYHLDVTFDLTVQSFGITRYDYFNLSDEDILRDHKIHTSPVPKCPISRDYYKEHGMFMPTSEDFKTYFSKCIKKGDKDVIFKLPVMNDFEKTAKKISAIASKVMTPSFFFFGGCQLCSNDSQYVFHLHMR